jgi:glycosyltransferase involved in cell wall biosynthesis
MPNTSDSMPRIVIISPCRNEEKTLEQTIESMAAQTLLPAQWIVVDDGSTDGTAAILAQAQKRLPWLRVATRVDRGHRKLGGGVIDAFNEGLDQVTIEHDFIAKMDVDLRFGPRYLEKIMDYFRADPSLAAASGKVYREENGGLVEEFMIDEMVAGQFKLYRRHCFDAIGGFVSAVMWDGIDFHRARMAGFRTRSIEDEELRLIHLRLMGSSDQNIYRGRLRWGRGQWFMGSSFSYIVASGLFRGQEKPYVIGGLCIIAGYLQGALVRAERYEDRQFRRDLRRWQRRRLVGLLLGRGPR